MKIGLKKSTKQYNDNISFFMAIKQQGFDNLKLDGVGPVDNRPSTD